MKPNLKSLVQIYRSLQTVPVDTKERKGIMFHLISVLILWGNRGGALLYFSSAFRMCGVSECLLKMQFPQLICRAVLSQLTWTESGSAFSSHGIIECIFLRTVLCCTDTSVCVVALWAVAGKSGWKAPCQENKREAWNDPSAVPAQLREWSSVGWASTKKLCVYIVAFPQYW